ncbi:maleylpyruvate isomerase N-terminal domain-containing protein [Lysinibacter cavernae]|uniref:Uncharacterized protein (TIGR03083 family) n=1 Tax=Lysinibacter cavernae TaxID=1640652 RepID=A0A7X5TTT0_9MICO|nr:maleylpyruvate isomerase N-terminal domain-containing protein [Lysinibacter cavernae]NIH52942.1 uncharacterized protein (TIGR03083 family) [Lysinibacter cavernae]
MTFSWSDSQRAFTDAADWFMQVTGLVRDQWADQGLGDWDIRSLIGHTSRSLITVEAYLAAPARSVDIHSSADYFRATRILSAGTEVTQRGIDAGIALGQNPKEAIAALNARVTALVNTRSGDERVTTIAGGMLLREYLPTRTFELAVHTADLARALGLPLSIPDSAARQALTIASELSLTNGTAAQTLLLLTGRELTTPPPSVL